MSVAVGHRTADLPARAPQAHANAKYWGRPGFTRSWWPRCAVRGGPGLVPDIDDPAEIKRRPTRPGHGHHARGLLDDQSGHSLVLFSTG